MFLLTYVMVNIKTVIL